MVFCYSGPLMYTDPDTDITYLVGIVFKSAGCGWYYDVSDDGKKLYIPTIYSRISDPLVLKWLSEYV